MSIREDLLRGNESGTLLEAVYACSLSREDHDALVSELVVLHNEGLVDAVTTFESLQDTSQGPDFFLTRHVFEEALPSLDAPVRSVMHCVLRLYETAGRDLAAGRVVDGFIQYLERGSSRSSEALAEIESNPDVFAILLPGVLVAGSRIDKAVFTTEAMRLCEDDNLELRRQAVFALGKLEWLAGSEAVSSAVSTLERSAGIEKDDRLLAGVVESAFALLQQDKALEPRIVVLMTSALEEGDEQAIHAASGVFAYHTGELTTAVLETLSVHLLRVKSGNKGTLDNIDFGVAQLLESGDSEKAFELIEALLLEHADLSMMDVLDGTGKAILMDSALTNRVATRWLLRGDRVLCEALRAILSAGPDDVPLEIDAAELEPADSLHIIFTARKAVGYLFTHPIAAASMLTSLMHFAAEDEVLTDLGKLLFDPLLLNYTGKAREYVVRQLGQESGQVKATVGEALARLDGYLEDLKSVGRLPALHPSTAHRDAHDRHLSRQMEESWKAAEASSVLLSLISKSVVLYGRTSITYVRGLDEQPRRMESPMQSHETEMELPRMLRLDPIGLDFRLRIFRAEQINA